MLSLSFYESLFEVIHSPLFPDWEGISYRPAINFPFLRFHNKLLLKCWETLIFRATGEKLLFLNVLSCFLIFHKNHSLTEGSWKGSLYLLPQFFNFPGNPAVWLLLLPTPPLCWNSSLDYIGSSCPAASFSIYISLPCHLKRSSPKYLL